MSDSISKGESSMVVAANPVFPWHVSYSPKHGEPFVTNHTGKEIICSVYGATFADADAKARLIATAPELREFAHDVLGYLCNANGVESYAGQRDELFERARALLDAANPEKI